MEIKALEGLPPTLTVEQAGEMLGICRRTAYRAAERGQIPTMRIGRRLLVPTAKLLALLGIDGAKKPTTPAAPPDDQASTAMTYEVSGDQAVSAPVWSSEQLT